MPDEYPSLSTDHVAAFVELAREGSLRKAALTLAITEQGLRNRLLALEERLGVELYRKGQGPRRSSPLTPQGHRFLPHALTFLEQARELTAWFGAPDSGQIVHVAATDDLLRYALIEAARRFQATAPATRVRFVTCHAQQIDDEMLNNPQIDVGVAARGTTSSDLHYRPWLVLPWALVLSRGRSPSGGRKGRLRDLIDEPLVFYEESSPLAEHLREAFRTAKITPRIEMELGSVELVVRMVEAGLGAGVVPLFADGSPTRGRKVGVFPLGREVAPMRYGALTRKGHPPSAAARAFVDSLLRAAPRTRRRSH
ncbi:MAG: LysR family transcriptional regulator [Planctomycetaceae bacterium]